MMEAPTRVVTRLCAQAAAFHPSDRLKALISALSGDIVFTTRFGAEDQAITHLIATGDLVVNLDQKTVEVSGMRVHLTGKEYQMLELLSLRKGTTLTKEMFLNHLYGGMDEPELKIIDVFICKLRKKLANASQGSNYIETVWGRGYVLREPNESEEHITA
jgi:DNA-binding response OmpR family regulator